MASGYFPTYKSDDFGKKLTAAIKLLDETVSEWYDCRCYLTPEDVGFDTTYIDTLGAAKAQIKSCIKLDTSSLEEVDAALQVAEQSKADLDYRIKTLTEAKQKITNKKS